VYVPAVTPTLSSFSCPVIVLKLFPFTHVPEAKLQAFVSFRAVHPAPTEQVVVTPGQVDHSRSLEFAVVTEEEVTMLPEPTMFESTGVPSNPEMVPV
jgi:hypothetical protein